MGPTLGAVLRDPGEKLARRPRDRGVGEITDFGLAGLEETIQDGEIRSGTPAYMAPEQLAGKEVTVRSDIYALGLVLYELFTFGPHSRASASNVGLVHRNGPTIISNGPGDGAGEGQMGNVR